ncbi:hypothetical protein M9Y10_044858 [Tritrichomonas musculus]|uniref:Uncharacterized protein n=1 Tax=Tritrichomonas musculus TaxID=1915356 RepID=A0ABR2JTL6_9EUKA
MFIDSNDYNLSPRILNDIYVILNGEKAENNPDQNTDSLKLYSITNKSFTNKGFIAKNRLFFGSTGMFKTSDEKTSTLPISLERKKKIPNNYFGYAFYMKMDSNLCYFNQALQIIFHCPIIYKLINK